MGELLFCVCAQVFFRRRVLWFVVCKARGGHFFCAYVCLCVGGERFVWFSVIYHNVGLQHCALQALIVTGRLGSLWVLLLSTRGFRRPLMWTTDIKHPRRISARQHKLLWPAGWGHVGRDHPSAGVLIQPLMPPSICPVEMEKQLLQTLTSDLDEMCKKGFLTQKINEVSR